MRAETDRIRYGWWVLALALACILPAATAHAATDTSKPNVIVIMTDDQGYGDIGAHGNPYIHTPALDRLHSESLRFTDFHVDPTCSPTRAALMTGRYSSRTGVWLTYASRHHLHRDEVTMADVFRENGYRTAIFGKWHLGDNYPFRPMDRGFDESLIHGGGVVGESPDHWGNDYYDDVYRRNDKPEQVSGYCTDVWFDEAVKFVTRNRSRPFFLYVPTNAPHGPRHVPVEYTEPYLNKPGVPKGRVHFYGMVTNIDENIARLRARLSALGISENTILIFLTDNGGTGGASLRRTLQPGEKSYLIDGFNAGMRGRKSDPYEGGHCAACFLHWPRGGFDKARDVDGLSAHFDLLPSLIDWCGLTAPAGVRFDGRSLAPVVRGDTDDWPDRTLFVHHQGRFSAKEILEGLPIKYKDYCVMTEKWRMVGKELYDYRADPGQLTDVAAQHPDVTARLARGYEDWWADISGKFDEHCPFVVDPAHQTTVLLTGQSWYGGGVPYNQRHVRAAMKSVGYWMIDVAQPGSYDIELRRWPRELNYAIDAKYPHPIPDPAKHVATVDQLPSKALDVKTARLKIGGFDQTRTVNSGDRAVRFRVNLNGGEQALHTWLTTGAGEEYSAYFVYVEPAGE